ncbi:MAG: hypothetical protein MUC69_04610 [Gemmatimonadales bacterium]|nr:hypothetical protein [Gemmatimonadales bacterium]
MYRVRLPSGDEKQYRSVEEMIWDAEMGVITPAAQIYHAATKAWVSVRQHPSLGARLPGEAGPEEVSLDFELLSEDEVAALAPAPAPGDDSFIERTPELQLGQDTHTAPEPELAPEPKPEPPAHQPPIVLDADAPAVTSAGEDGRDSAVPDTDVARLEAEQRTLRESLHGASPGIEITTTNDFLESMAPPVAPPPAAPPSPPPVLEPAAPAPPPVYSALPEPAMVEPPLDGDLAPLPGEEEPGQTWTTDYQPLEWKPERRFAPLLRVVGLVGAVVVVAGGAFLGWRAWSAREAGVEPDAGLDSVVTQPIDTVADSVLARAMQTLAIAETAGTGLMREPGGRDRFRNAPVRPIEALRAMSPSELRRSYAAAYGIARAEMDSDFTVAGVRSLFATSRLASVDSLRAGRRLVQTARNIVRTYYSNEVQIERAYRDTVAFQVARMGWGTSQQNDWKSRAVLKESYEGAQLTDSLLTRIDEVYVLLLGQSGNYRVGGGTIAFGDPRAADDYARLAAWLGARIGRVGAGDDERGTNPTARRIVGALQGTRPPALARGGGADD